MNAQWTYTWDGENRLIAAEENTSVHLQPSGATPVKRQRLEFAYDSQGRRISKRVLLAEAGSTMFVLKQGIVFLYDGWNMVAEIDITQTEPRLLRSYEWGLDVSGPMEGAGGVGGLLVERFHSATSSSAYAPCYDGNGNVVELVSLTSGAVVGRYEYGSFGETISVEGEAVVLVNPVRFSSKYWDGETGLVYYTHRYYEATNGRWLNRDPIGEEGGLNLYGMVGNDPANQVDVLGMASETFNSITVKRKQVRWLAILRSQIGKKPDNSREDPYGHWWFEFDGESYGGWPADGVGLIETVTGVPGRLNGTNSMHASGLASATRDGHHGDSAEESWHPRRRTGFLSRGKLEFGSEKGADCNCVTEDQIKDCLRNFAQQYSGNWSYPWGQNCHSFQKAALKAYCLKK